MGTDRRDKTCEGPPYVTEDTIKLPHLEKPKWMGEIESALRSASPPKVGMQATRQIRWLNWVDSFKKGADFSTFSQDGASSECSGDSGARFPMGEDFCCPDQEVEDSHQESYGLTPGQNQCFSSLDQSLRTSFGLHVFMNLDHLFV